MVTKEEFKEGLSELTNSFKEEFRVIVGEFNARFDRLEEQFGLMGVRFDSLETRVTDIQHRVVHLEEQMEDVQDRHLRKFAA